jgi:hypothetical protein
VPPSSTFYTYVNNLYKDGIVSGYACGGPTEPCDPAGRPYYRPAGNVTRQQMAKFEDLGRRLVTGDWTGSPDNGIFSAINTDYTHVTAAGLYGVGVRGVWGESHTTGSAGGAGGYFYNFGGSTGPQYGVYAETVRGPGVYGQSDGSGTGGNPGVFGQGPIGVLGETSAATGAGGVFSATLTAGSVGVVATGLTGAVLKVLGSTVSVSGDGLDVGGTGGFSDAVYSAQPVGDANFSFYGYAHIHGTNIAASDYEQEAVYDGATPLPLGRVVALDPDNQEGGPLGVIPADIDNAGDAIGVVSYRLDTTLVNGVDKPYIDPTATEVQPGDRVYISFAGRVKMKPAGHAKVGTRLAVGPEGTAVVAPSQDGAGIFGKVASLPSADGTVDVVVNFK